MTVPVWVIATLKGGTRKTTTAVMLAFELTKRGEEVLLVDADHGTQGVMDWTGEVHDSGQELPFHVVQWSPAQGRLSPFLQKHIRETKATRTVVDIGGEAPQVLKEIAYLATLVVSPIAPERGELGRVHATNVVVKEAGVRLLALLTRVPRPGVGIAREARDFLIQVHGQEVLYTEIPQDRETYAHVWGTIPRYLGAYTKLTDELLTLEGGTK